MNIIVLQHIKIEDPGYIKDLMLADGFNSIWVNRSNNIFDNLDYKPNLEIKNLKDLLPNINSN